MAKQNTSTVRAARHAANDKSGIGSGKSAYSKKVLAGNQMYGDGKRCCAHRIKLSGHPQVQS